MADLDVGGFINKVGVALSEVAVGVMQSGDKGKVVIELDLEMCNGEQALVKSKLKFIKPTSRGKQSEEDTTETLMYVARNGALSLLKQDQNQMFNRDGNIIEHQ